MSRIAAYLVIALLVIGGAAYVIVDKIVGDEKKCRVTQSSQGDGYVNINGECEVTQTP